MSLSVPFDKALLQSGVHISLALKLYEDGVLTLVKAATLAQLSTENFMEKLASYGVVVVDQSEEELAADLNVFDE